MTGNEMHGLIERLYPICRSITGSGVRETLAVIGSHIPLEASEVPSGTPVLDWTVPDEWNIRDAYVIGPAGERAVDFRTSNVHIVSYSEPVDATMRLQELDRHLHSLPEHPSWIPYRTSYYERTWGFCMAHEQRQAMANGEYRVRVDSTLEPGHLTYGECLLPGESTDEVLISCHICHPSLCNDNLSGIAVAVALARHLEARSRHLTYRFVFLPGTIGSITWLARNEESLDRIKHGVVLTGLGDAGFPHYKRSRRGNATVDRAFEHVLTQAGDPFEIRPFDPYGYDERQYCSPGFDLPVGRFMRTPNGEYPEYHTSADDLAFVHPASLADSLEKCRAVMEILDGDRTYRNGHPKGEPQLGRRGIYKGLRGQPQLPQIELALLWVLNQSDGKHSLFDIAERAAMPFSVVREAADILSDAELLEPAEPE